MKKLSLLLIVVFSVFIANAQITISDNNVFVLGDNITYQKIFDVDETFDVGAAGENVIWDFSGLTEGTENELYEYIAPTGKPHIDEMPSIDLAERLNGNDNAFFYFDNNGGTEWNRSGTYINDQGTQMWWHYEIGAVPTSLQLISYPFTYNTDFVIEPFGGHGAYDMAGSQDDLVIPNNGSYHFECDGYGTLKMPHKIYPNALRVHVTEEFTINLLMSGTPVVSMDIADDAYYWFVDGVKGPVMSFVASTTTSSSGTDVTYNAKWYREDLSQIFSDFVANQTTGTTDDTISFTNLSEPLNQGSTFLWDFSPNTVTFKNGTDATSTHPDVSFNNPGLYTITLTTTNTNFSPDFASEIKTDYIEISAAPELVVDFTADNTSPALSSPVNFTATVNDENGTTYHWAVSPGVNGTHWGFTNFTNETDKNPQLMFYQAGCYSIQFIATNSNYSNSPVTVTKMNYINAGGGCGNSYTVTFTVTDGTNPINGAEIFITGQSSINTDASGVATINLFDATYNYTVTATDYDDYSGSFTVNGADLNVDVSMAVGIEALESENIKIFPNPTNSIFKVVSEEPVFIQLFDISGKQIFSSNKSNTNFEIDLSNKSKGLYFINIIKNNKVFTEKIILK